jgi:hypothetical protein
VHNVERFLQSKRCSKDPTQRLRSMAGYGKTAALFGAICTKGGDDQVTPYPYRLGRSGCVASLIEVVSKKMQRSPVVPKIDLPVKVNLANIRRHESDASGIVTQAILQLRKGVSGEINGID